MALELRKNWVNCGDGELTSRFNSAGHSLKLTHSPGLKSGPTQLSSKPLRAGGACVVGATVVVVGGVVLVVGFGVVVVGRGGGASVYHSVVVVISVE